MSNQIDMNKVLEESKVRGIANLTPEQEAKLDEAYETAKSNIDRVWDAIEGK